MVVVLPSSSWRVVGRRRSPDTVTPGSDKSNDDTKDGWIALPIVVQPQRGMGGGGGGQINHHHHNHVPARR